MVSADEIRVTHSGADEADQRFVRARLVQFDVFEREGLVSCPQYSGSRTYTHSLIPLW